MNYSRQQNTGARVGVRTRGWPTGLCRSLLDWLYPRHCYECGKSLNGTRAHMLCADCFRDLLASRITGAICEQCGLPLGGEPEPGSLCLTCRTERRHFDLARAFFTYSGPAVSLIRHYKFEGDFFLGPKLLYSALDRGWLPPDIGSADVVVAVPLHPRRRRERGYDQAWLLTRVLPRRLGLRLVRGALARTRYTSQQALLPVGRRWDNVRGAFTTRRPEKVRAQSVLLVDDVMTTGTTADECAKVLKKAGATQVQVLTLTRTAP
ncbi:MAG: double zinc ribbon domain-containing protein [Planctomycetota bacterium]|jgi:ComF family protein